MILAHFRQLLAVMLAVTSAASGRSVANRYKRMVNGNIAAISDWPFIASLKYSASSNVLWKICSASLVARDWLVTVAHCVKDANETTIGIKDLKVQLRRRQDSWETDDYEVRQISTHPISNIGDFLEGIESDIALIQLKLNAPRHMATIQIHQGLDTVHNCRSAGWGSKNQLQNGHQDVLTGNYEISDSLQSITVPHLVAWNNCDFLPFIGQNLDMTKNRKFFCGGETGARGNGQHGCIGDSGSPLICEVNSSFVLYGILAGGNPQCVPGSTHMAFVDVFKHRQWMNGIMHGRLL